MVAVSGVLILAGYQLVTYGWSQVRGANAGFFDILWPGRYTGNTPDASGSPPPPPPPPYFAGQSPAAAAAESSAISQARAGIAGTAG